MKHTVQLFLFLSLLFLSCKKDSSAQIDVDSTYAITICSFNIQFLGNSTKRDNEALVQLLHDFDVVVVQELVSPPYVGFFPEGSPFKPDAESAAFFDLMQAAGFSYHLSEEDTGTGDNIHRNGSSTEWWVAFYKPEILSIDTNIPHGFLADDRSNNSIYERVPYAFGFTTCDNRLDFSLISVHLKPGDGSADLFRRKQEFEGVFSWIAKQDSVEKDFFVLGDMNFKNCEEIAQTTLSTYKSLNDECIPTNTNVNGPKPYDNVFYRPIYSTELDSLFDMQVLDLVSTLDPTWDTLNGVYPGKPYNHNVFRQYYSDHHPVSFRLWVGKDDD